MLQRSGKKFLRSAPKSSVGRLKIERFAGFLSSFVDSLARAHEEQLRKIMFDLGFQPPKISIYLLPHKIETQKRRDRFEQQRQIPFGQQQMALGFIQIHE